MKNNVETNSIRTLGFNLVGLMKEMVRGIEEFEQAAKDTAGGCAAKASHETVSLRFH